MQVIHSVREMQAYAERERAAGNRLALVPTLGALHEGHLQLIRKALQAADQVVVSIFVNPTQFGPDEDLERYPRDLEGDVDTLQSLGVDVAFAPSVAEMYPGIEEGEENLTWVEVEKLDRHLCGRYRPGHFRGVATVVAKLFNICRPHVAVFGRKDAQQLVIIRRMVRDLHFGIEILDVEIVREADGLARSSRNAYLSEEDRQQATVLSEAVKRAQERIEEGEQGVEGIVESMRKTIAQAPHANLEYAEVVDRDTLEPQECLQPGQDVIAAVAVYFGDTRLIDNAFARVPAAP